MCDPHNNVQLSKSLVSIGGGDFSKSLASMGACSLGISGWKESKGDLYDSAEVENTGVVPHASPTPSGKNPTTPLVHVTYKKVLVVFHLVISEVNVLLRRSQTCASNLHNNTACTKVLCPFIHPFTDRGEGVGGQVSNNFLLEQ